MNIDSICVFDKENFVIFLSIFSNALNDSAHLNFYHHTWIVYIHANHFKYQNTLMCHRDEGIWYDNFWGVLRERKRQHYYHSKWKEEEEEREKNRIENISQSSRWHFLYLSFTRMFTCRCFWFGFDFTPMLSMYVRITQLWYTWLTICYK